MSSSEPVECKITNMGNLKLSLWSQLKYNNMTFLQLIESFNLCYDLNIDQIMFNDKIIYSIFMNDNKKKDISSQNILEYLNVKEALLNIAITSINDENQTEIINIKII